ELIMFDNKTKTFFESFIPLNGVVTNEGSIISEWDTYQAKSGLFAIKAPPVNAPFFETAPDIHQSGDTDTISLSFRDPVWNQQVFYTVYGYRFDKPMSYENAEAVMLDTFVQKHRGTTQGLRFKKGALHKLPTLSVDYQTRSPEGYPYINRVKLRGMFYNNYLVVQEALGPQHLVDSAFLQKVFDLIQFTPLTATSSGTATETTGQPIEAAPDTDANTDAAGG
ncbi:MAG: hypothetical protein ACPGRX_07130, partial [Bdellovibrionales bacterium]